MWLVWYVATIGSLSALSLLPTMDIKPEQERTPYADKDFDAVAFTSPNRR
jgi:uroporphyrinogen-III synthase